MGPFRLERWARNVVIIKFVPPEVKKKQTNEQKTNLTDDQKLMAVPELKSDQIPQTYEQSAKTMKRELSRHWTPGNTDQ